MAWFPWLQLAWALLVCLIIGERAVSLFLRLPTSAQAARSVAAMVRERELEPLRVWSQARASTLLGRLVARSLHGTGDAPSLVLGELAEEAGARLLWVRTAATLSSTLGLLGGVLALANGLGGQGGLLALERGLAEREALAQALESMALGVGSAALCFFALARFRAAYRALVTQAQTVAHLLAELGPADVSDAIAARASRAGQGA